MINSSGPSFFSFGTQGGKVAFLSLPVGRIWRFLEKRKKRTERLIAGYKRFHLGRNPNAVLLCLRQHFISLQLQDGFGSWPVACLRKLSLNQICDPSRLASLKGLILFFQRPLGYFSYGCQDGQLPGIFLGGRGPGGGVEGLGKWGPRKKFSRSCLEKWKTTGQKGVAPLEIKKNKSSNIAQPVHLLSQM